MAGLIQAWNMDSAVCFLSNSSSQGHFDGLVQDCSISIANALEILQSCTKPSISTTVD